MLAEIAGFAAGSAAAVAALLIFLRFERWRTIRPDDRGTKHGQAGNALIWPGH